MAPIKAGDQIVLATGNAGKVREIAGLLQDISINVIPQSEFSVIEAEETGLTFVENAIIKARNAAQATGLPAIADDSGLEVDALRGAPGIYSSRFAGPDSDDTANNRKLLADLESTPDDQRQARFHCVMVFMEHPRDPTPLICQGSWQGSILHEARGKGGFGYDPLFWVEEHQCSAAELPPELKQRISHRGQALARLIDAMHRQVKH
jgi:XTP/dITP diphosphohydrolase